METWIFPTFAKIKNMGYKSSYEEWKLASKLMIGALLAGYKSSYEEWKHRSGNVIHCVANSYKSSYEEWKLGCRRLILSPYGALQIFL